MEPEILFRGKRMDNGEWAYGWYCKHAFGRWPIKSCIIPSEQAENGCVEHVEVDPTTVGQYTGLTDKNGVKIFNGDILATTNPNCKIWYVDYKPTAFCINHLNTNYSCVLDEFVCTYEIEVIGNQEFLGGAK